MRKKTLLLLFLPILLTFIVTGCVDLPEEFHAPVYDISINIPITEKTYDLQEAIEKDTSMIKFNYNQDDPARLYYVNDTISIEKITVDDNLAIDDFSSEFSQEIGSVEINDVEPVVANVAVTDWAAVTPGTQMIFPDSQGDVNVPFEKVDQFESVTLDGGTLNISVRNNLPVDLQIRSFNIRNVANQESIADTSQFLDIPAGQSLDLAFNLAGKTILNELEFVGRLRTAGSGLNLVTIPADAGTEITTSFDNLSIASATAPLPAQDPFTKDSTFVIDEQTKIQEAVVSEGTFQIEFTNNFDMDITVDLEIPNMKDNNNATFSETIFIPRKTAASLYNVPRNLTDWRIISTTSQPTNELGYNVVVNTAATTDARTITKEDKIDIDITMAGLVFESVEGQVKPTDFDIDATSFEFDLEDLKDAFTYESLTFGDPEIVLVLSSSANIDLRMNAVLTGKNNTMEKDMLLPNIDIAGGGSTRIKLSEYGLSDLLNSFSGSFPEEFVISGQAVINPEYQTGSVTRNDSITGNVEIEIPLDLAIKGGSVKDTVEFDLGDVDESDIEKVNEGQIYIQLRNAIPIGFTFSGAVYDIDTQTEILQLPPRGQIIDFPAPTIDNNGDVTSPAVLDQTNPLTFNITGDELKSLIKHKNIILDLKMATPSGGTIPVKFRTTDELYIKVYASGSYKLDLSSDDDE